MVILPFAVASLGIDFALLDRKMVALSIVYLVAGLGMASYSMSLTLPSAGFVMPSAKWLMVLGACTCGSIGLLFFTSLIAEASREELPALFIIMNVMQIAIPALFLVSHNLVMKNGDEKIPDWRTIAGISSAFLTAFFLKVK